MLPLSVWAEPQTQCLCGRGASRPISRSLPAARGLEAASEGARWADSTLMPVLWGHGAMPGAGLPVPGPRRPQAEMTVHTSRPCERGPGARASRLLLEELSLLPQKLPAWETRSLGTASTGDLVESDKSSLGKCPDFHPLPTTLPPHPREEL